MSSLMTLSIDQSIEKLLVHCHRRTFAAKAAIIRQGDPAGELYYIISGSVTVLLEDDKGHEIVLAYLNPGDFFGEIGLFNEDANRTALVRARSETEIAQIGYKKLKGLTEIYPDSDRGDDLAIGPTPAQHQSQTWRPGFYGCLWSCRPDLVGLV
jgi:CRP-like cAMP-binding protein